MIDTPQFGASDVAELLDETEATVRRWHHSGLQMFFGRKEGHSVLYTARDVAGFAIARDLVRIGFPPILAGRIGASVTYRNPESDTVLEGSPAEIAMIAPPPGSGIHMDRQAWRVPAQTNARIELPIGRIFADVTEKATRLRNARAH